MKIDAPSVVYTVMGHIEHSFEDIEWLLEDLDVPVELEEDFKRIVQEIKSLAYSYKKPAKS